METDKYNKEKREDKGGRNKKKRMAKKNENQRKPM